MDEPARLDRLRQLCMGLPEATERLSHGEPTWFVRDKKSFVTFSNRHHGGPFGFWCAARFGAQDALTSSNPEVYFRPPYVGQRGWLGVRLDTAEVDWAEIERVVREAYVAVAPARLLAALDG